MLILGWFDIDEGAGVPLLSDLFWLPLLVLDLDYFSLGKLTVEVVGTRCKSKPWHSSGDILSFKLHNLISFTFLLPIELLTLIRFLFTLSG